MGDNDLPDDDVSRIPEPIKRWSKEERKVLKATPYSSAEVERAYSVFKAMFRTNRQSFEFRTFQKFVITKYIIQKVSIITNTQKLSNEYNIKYKLTLSIFRQHSVFCDLV